MSEDLAAVWDEIARRGDERDVFGHPTLTWDEGVALCRAQIEPLLESRGHQYLDVGCGPGRLLAALAKSFPHSYFAGLDISKLMLAAVPYRANVVTFLGDAREPVQVDLIDGAYSVLLLQHLDHAGQRAVLRNVFDALRPGGWFRFQFVTPNGDAQHDEETALSHPTEVLRMFQWCAEVGFVPEVVPGGEYGRLCDRQDEFPTWAWMTARKP